MNTQLILTSDGSHTLLNETLNVYYHSVHGALQESRHIFIKLGLQEAMDRYVLKANQNPKTLPLPVCIFEMGFGTGLNAVLTWLEAEKMKVPIHYVTIEAFPIEDEQVQLLNYNGLLNTNRLLELHYTTWEKTVSLSPYFTFEKHQTSLQEFDILQSFDAIYYDAFAPSAQPELWTQEIFEKLAGWLKPGGNLTTYCSKSYVRRHLQAAGLRVEKHPGPPGKREVLRAFL